MWLKEADNPFIYHKIQRSDTQIYDMAVWPIKIGACDPIKRPLNHPGIDMCVAASWKTHGCIDIKTG